MWSGEHRRQDLESESEMVRSCVQKRAGKHTEKSHGTGSRGKKTSGKTKENMEEVVTEDVR